MKVGTLISTLQLPSTRSMKGAVHVDYKQGYEHGEYVYDVSPGCFQVFFLLPVDLLAFGGLISQGASSSTVEPSHSLLACV